MYIRVHSSELNEDLTDAVNMKYDPEKTLRRVCHVRTILIASSQIVTDSNFHLSE